MQTESKNMFPHILSCGILCSLNHTHNRLKMDGGWGRKMAKWEHFPQTLSMKFLFSKKVSDPSHLHVI